ncbi:aldolase [Bacillus canaveralius]|uniref:Aldolase n=1 Tax=Bacillus canaveralius TaxID=1403243 RepID=A0A2N5GMN6_9BACI|nr:class II aldolase/adducin family protein [Bacillus canaveralius]PLR83269.1 aldolase [Bacillus canaveralius]PLR96684.1 aldolase [Bacillus canaveralius]RSK55238.1 class II aldolase/adducin family protein [Bacillus canaveralius]
MSDPLYELREKVALSCRILAMEGLVDETLGHVSARIPDTNEMFIRCRGEQEDGVRYTTVEAIRRVNFDGQGDDLQGKYQIPKELPIHGEIMKSRPEVGCVIHAHPPAALICGISDLPLRPIFGAFNIPAMRMALEGIPIFPRSYLVTRSELATPLIEEMGEKNICLMKGHGITATGATVEEATINALNFNTLAKVTLEVSKTGREASVISDEDVAELPDLGTKFNAKWVWRYYVRKLRETERIKG